MTRMQSLFSAAVGFVTILFSSPPCYAQAETQTITDVATEKIETVRSLINMIMEFSVKYSFQVLGGIVVLVLGWLVAKYVANFIGRLFEKHNVDITVSKFAIGAVKLLIMVFAIMVALGKFGIEIAPLIAGISVIGFGTSFALQGPLSNYASGISLIFAKPFKVGDIIEVAGVVGEVQDVKLPRTELKTIDGTVIIIPNKHIVGEIIQNYSSYKRLDITVGVSYKTDMQKAIDVVSKVVSEEIRVVKDPVPKVGISEFADSSVNIYARIWCKQADYWDTLFDLNKKIFYAFAKDKIEIPFPQRDVHLIKEK